MPESTYHQIHFAWAEPTLLGRIGPGPAASSLTESDQPALRSWRDRLIPALTVDYRAAMPDIDPADLPETLWSHTYPDGQAALVYRRPGDVRDAHAWAVVGPAYGLTMPRILGLHENPNTRPAARRPPRPGWATMPALDMPGPWERTAAPGAVRTRDRRAAETTVEGELLLPGAVAAALYRPDRPLRIALKPEKADLWQAVQLRFLWGMYRTLHDVLTPPRAIPAAGWSWSFSTYEPSLDNEGPHLVFGPPDDEQRATPFLNTPEPDYRRVAEGLVTLLRDEGGDALSDQLRERGVPDAPTFADRRALLLDWFDPPTESVVPPRGVKDTEGREDDTEEDAEDLPGTEDLPLDEPPEAQAPPATPQRAFARSVAGAHPSLHLVRTEETADTPDTEDPEDDDLPEVEDLDDTPIGPIPERAPGPSRTLFGERRPRFVDAEEEPPDPPTDEDERGTEPLFAEPARSPSDAPALGLDGGPVPKPPAPDYASETEPTLGESFAEDNNDNWPTQYADLPLARLERWHVKRGPEGARVDIVDARAAVRAERAELRRVREERDHYHTEVQDLRREVARLDRPFLDSDEEVSETRTRKWPARMLVPLLLIALFATGLEVGARFDTGATDLISLIPGL